MKDDKYKEFMSYVALINALSNLQINISLATIHGDILNCFLGNDETHKKELKRFRHQNEEKIKLLNERKDILFSAWDSLEIKGNVDINKVLKKWEVSSFGIPGFVKFSKKNNK